MSHTYVTHIHVTHTHIYISEIVKKLRDIYVIYVVYVLHMHYVIYKCNFLNILWYLGNFILYDYL